MEREDLYPEKMETFISLNNADLTILCIYLIGTEDE